MSSPAKRRKKNDHRSSNQPIRNLDYFFTKQTEGVAKGATATNKHNEGKIIDEAQATEGQGESALTDEALARRLQDEWNKEEQNEYIGGSNSLHDHAISPLKNDIANQNLQNAKGPDPLDCPTFDKATLPLPKLKNTLSLQSTATEEDIVSATIPFDESPLEFQPSRYMTDLQKYWASIGGHASYALLTRCFVLVNNTTSRIKIVDTLVNFLRTIIEGDPESLLPAVW